MRRRSMLIQCTKSLLDKIEVSEKELVPKDGHETFPNSFMTWHANFLTIDRRKTIVLMNNETRYPVVIYRPSKTDFKNIKILIREAIVEAFRVEGIRKDLIEEYMNTAGDITFSKTANRSLVAKLNNSVREVEFTSNLLDEQTTIQRFISLRAGKFIQRSGEDEYFYPIENVYKSFENFSGTNEILDIDMYQLKIQIDIEGHEIWRRVLVPSTYSFYYLHNIIQSVFDWHNTHLHEFTVDRADKKPLMLLMDDSPETMDLVNPDVFSARQERFVALEEVFPKYNEVRYVYDYGDYWEHNITLEKVGKGNELQATYLEGIGERPPEDVGGSPGFEEYISIISNENDPEYASMKVWAESQKERQVSPEKMNERLESSIYKYYYSSYL